MLPKIGLKTEEEHEGLLWHFLYSLGLRLPNSVNIYLFLPALKYEIGPKTKSSTLILC